MRSTPVRLEKQEDDFMIFNLNEKIENFAMKYAPIMIVLCVILLMALFIALCFALMGNGAVESGVEYNHFNNII